MAETTTQPAEVTEQVRGNLAFGFGQMNTPTPKWANLAFRWFFYVTGIVTVALDIFTEIPPDVKLTINSTVIKANLLLHAVSKMFGIKLPDNN